MTLDPTTALDPSMALDPTVLRDTERQRLRSLVEADLDAADGLHAEDYQLITPSGYALTKQGYLGAIASGQLRYQVFEPVSDIAVRGSGRVALVRYRARIIIEEPPGPAQSFTCWHTDSYETRNGRWQAVWSQATVIQPETE